MKIAIVDRNSCLTEEIRILAERRFLFALSRFGSKIEDEVKEDMVNSTFFDAIESHELKVIGTPSFENIVFSPGDPLTYEAAVELAPTFEIPNYVGLEIDAQPVSVGADEVTKEIDEILEQQTRLEFLESGILDG